MRGAMRYARRAEAAAAEDDAVLLRLERLLLQVEVAERLAAADHRVADEAVHAEELRLVGQRAHADVVVRAAQALALARAAGLEVEVEVARPAQAGIEDLVVLLLGRDVARHGYFLFV